MHSEPSSLQRLGLIFLSRNNRFQKTLGHWTAWLSLSLVLLSAMVVVMRYGFDFGNVALQETLIYNHAIFFMLGMAYTLQQDAHVRVDVFYSRFDLRQKAWVNLLGSLLLALPAMAFLFVASFDYVTGSWAIQEGSSEAGGLAWLYLLKSFILIMAALMITQILALASASGLLLTLSAEQRQHPLAQAALSDTLQALDQHHNQEVA
ncbi:TRAP transporter small permease subunit [Hydrogenovibrio halophilus]|uniref:TRAP transporter small permease subunit n=1 Tax=Hydrogenovibrio halophilus TaxID=373391 RepID=UPI00035E3541|nr:TRAP transporter small permease subunit [Hydrogenovibrio halophilus]